jgi:hypothetical protein
MMSMFVFFWEARGSEIENRMSENERSKNS